MNNVFKNEASKICGRQSLKNYTWFTLEFFVRDISRKMVTFMT